MYIVYGQNQCVMDGSNRDVNVTSGPFRTNQLHHLIEIVATGIEEKKTNNPYSLDSLGSVDPSCKIDEQSL